VPNLRQSAPGHNANHADHACNAERTAEYRRNAAEGRRSDPSKGSPLLPPLPPKAPVLQAGTIWA
jgi:hypothetical protein